MELFGLKNENGKDVRLIVTDNPYIHSHPTMKVEVIEPELEFKVGDWVVFDNPTQEGLPVIFRITRVENNYVLDDSNTSYGKTKYLRLADTDEIESHLRKICDEKYVGKKVRCIGFENEVHEIKEFSLYNNEYDLMYYYIYDNADTCCVYQGGRFAEIVADEFKKLPKTVDELVLLLQDFDRDGGQLTPWGFLTERGYKTT